MEKTVVVQVERTHRHPRYGKVVVERKKHYAHDEQQSAGVGDLVRIVESRPLSRTKRWVVEEVLEKSRMVLEVEV
jgi:small subunit ribosomal protein S17